MKAAIFAVAFGTAAALVKCSVVKEKRSLLGLEGRRRGLITGKMEWIDLTLGFAHQDPGRRKF